MNEYIYEYFNEFSENENEAKNEKQITKKRLRLDMDTNILN